MRNFSREPSVPLAVTGNENENTIGSSNEVPMKVIFSR
jgi:hypothetical protein